MKLVVTFTNPQLVRNYLFDLEINFINQLKYEELSIICNNRTHDSIRRMIDALPGEIRSKIKLYKINFNFNEFLSLKILNFISKCHVHSKFCVAKFFRHKSKKEISTFNLTLKFATFIITFNNLISAKTVRLLTLFFLRKTSSFNQLSFLSNYDLFLALSLTDDLDTLIISFAKTNGIKSIGTVRSWDNLTSHGLIRVKPDIFYCHSESMAADLSKYQYYGCNSQNTVLGFSNWLNFKKIEELKSQVISYDQKNIYKILYGAMGEYFNPGEETFLSNLIDLVQKDLNIDLVVLMHPTKLLPEEFQKQFGTRIIFDKFDFNNDHNMLSYTDYLEYLSKFDLVLSSGSTLLLDACIINKNIAHVNFEMRKVPYWESIKRYSDFRDYYKSFLKLSKTPILSSFKELSIKIQDRFLMNRLIVPQQNLASKHFMGSPEHLSLSDLINNHS